MDLSVGDYEILVCIGQNPEYDASEIAEELDISQSSVSSTIYEFRKNNLIVSANPLPNSSSEAKELNGRAVDDSEQEDYEWLLLESGRAKIYDYMVELQERVNQTTEAFAESKIYRNNEWDDE